MAMKKNHRSTTIGFAGLLLQLVAVFCTNLAHAEMWETCASSLSSLKSGVNEMTESAEAVQNALRDYELRRTEVQGCLKSPQIFDIYRDGCRSKIFDLESVRIEYEGAVGKLKIDRTYVFVSTHNTELICEAAQLNHRPPPKKLYFPKGAPGRL